MSPPALTPLPWDSAWLGFGVARLEAPAAGTLRLVEALAQAREMGCRLLYVLATPADESTATLLQQAGARLADHKLVLHRAVAGAETAPPELQPTRRPTPALHELAQQSSQFSRFRHDPRLPAGACETLYRRWLNTALADPAAHAVWTEARPPARSLLALARHAAHAHIDLLAVSAAARQQGRGRRLLAAAAAQATAWGVPALHVTTQAANGPACALYAQAGFGLLSARHVYHLWL